MVWGCLTYYGVGTLAFIDGNMNSQKYIQTLDDLFRCFSPDLQLAIRLNNYHHFIGIDYLSPLIINSPM
jgi:hypothetical protein